MFGCFAFAVLTACLVLALDTALAAWLAALVVAALYGAVAGVLALSGKKQVQEAAPAVPEQTVETVKEDVRWTKHTREELGETVEALAAKTDVKGQARAKLDETKERARDAVGAVKEKVASAKPAGPAVPGADAARPAAAGPLAGSRPASTDIVLRLRREPVLFALLGAFAAGVLVRSLARGR